ncbi:tRNA/rRNA methyltransferase SpoU [Edaphobacter acidisoli]|uniref:tRNA/rRNA methyltransferase SpoU n=1 Tax=Edaphobacter acidisoli TaxID=2040573 RepID=A0A916W2J9_9BACT|nr:RNA methyltransferase [Edaphobacter acidisoli]GGA61022.1 tRNA/rRNA methyltransferase SpoU [Edaphobacter acidisoli]
MLISSKTNTRVKQLRAAFDGNARLGGGLVAIEGLHLLEEALRSGIVPETVFLVDGREVPELPRGVEVVRLTEAVFRSAVETPSPQGVAALIAPPSFGMEDALVGTPLLVIAAGLQDPGNLGTLVRSAEAFGATGVLTTPGTVSAWNQKALRASVGSVFRVPVVGVSTDDLRGLKVRGVRLFAAVGSADGRTESAVDADFAGACALMIGNEGAGLGAEWMELADARVTVPCPGPVESLNAAVAGSVLLYEASRQRAAVHSSHRYKTARTAPAEVAR